MSLRDIIYTHFSGTDAELAQRIGISEEELLLFFGGVHPLQKQIAENLADELDFPKAFLLRLLEKDNPYCGTVTRSKKELPESRQWMREETFAEENRRQMEELHQQCLLIYQINEMNRQMEQQLLFQQLANQDIKFGS